MQKNSLRKKYLALRKSIASEECAKSSIEAQLKILRLKEFNNAGCVAIYAPFQNEIDTAMIARTALDNGKRLLYPAICGDEMKLREVYCSGSLEEGAFGIAEPCSNAVEHAASEVDFMVVPGIVFDLCGSRIGFGKGFYDKALANVSPKPFLVAMCHNFQILEDFCIPAESHDIRMDIIVTDKRVIRTNLKQLL